jgi:hypothetical protein
MHVGLGPRGCRIPGADEYIHSQAVVCAAEWPAQPAAWRVEREFYSQSKNRGAGQAVHQPAYMQQGAINVCRGGLHDACFEWCIQPGTVLVDSTVMVGIAPVVGLDVELHAVLRHDDGVVEAVLEGGVAAAGDVAADDNAAIVHASTFPRARLEQGPCRVKRDSDLHVRDVGANSQGVTCKKNVELESVRGP